MFCGQCQSLFRGEWYSCCSHRCRWICGDSRHPFPGAKTGVLSGKWSHDVVRTITGRFSIHCLSRYCRNFLHQSLLPILFDIASGDDNHLYYFRHPSDQTTPIAGGFECPVLNVITLIVCSWTKVTAAPPRSNLTLIPDAPRTPQAMRRKLKKIGMRRRAKNGKRMMRMKRTMIYGKKRKTSSSVLFSSSN